MADVFISYAREDRPRADWIARNLAQMGLDVFWDSEIPPGQTWADYVEDKLSHCKVVIVLWSEHSTKSQWVREEARMGRDKGKLIPVMIDATPAPFGFGEVQAANLSTWDGQPNHPEWMRVAAAVRSAAGAPASPAPPPAVQPARPATIPPPHAATAQAFAGASAAAPKRNNALLIALAAGGVILVLLFVAFGAMMNAARTATTTDALVTDVGTTTTPPTPPAQGDQNPTQIIMAQLQADQQSLANQGYQLIGQPQSGGLAQGQTWNMPVQLVPGVEYRLIGVCDRDCSDLDLVLHDQSGAILAQDTETNDHPQLAAQTPYAGNFVIEVRMYNCSVPPCYYAIALYGRRM
ncbi:MAG: toll/interleukin-1 receptor domain-containing protein [Pseudomonadota bacterium]